MARKITAKRNDNGANSHLNQCEYMTINELAAVMHITRNTAIKLATTEGFPMVKVGRCYRINIADFRKWQEDNRGKSIKID